LHQKNIRHKFVDMSIFDQQLADKKLEDVVYFLAERMMRAARDKTKEVFKTQRFGVTIDQWLILKRIAETTAITQIDLAQTTFKDPAAVTRILDILERKGLAERHHKIGDRRSYEIQLSEKGKKLVEKMTPFVQELRKQGLKGLSETETEILKKALRKMYKNLV
jgi:DNA-binding MarR family transcriptional regulator